MRSYCHFCRVGQIDQSSPFGGRVGISRQRAIMTGMRSAMKSMKARTAGSMPWREVNAAWIEASGDDQSERTGTRTPLLKPRSTIVSGSRPRPTP